MLKLLHTKLDKPKLLTTFPNNSTGSDGDIVISTISGKGTYICVKSNGRWYAANKMEDLSNVGKSSFSKLSSNKLTVKEVENAGSDTDKFLVLDAGNQLKFRTGSETLSDIGALGSLTFGIADTNAVKIDSSSVADDEYARFTASGLESRSTAEVLSDIGAQATVTAGTNCTFAGATLNVDDAFITNNADDVMNGNLTLRKVSDDANAAELILQKERSDTTIDDNDYVGKILFKAYDDQGTPEIMTAGQISIQVLDASSNDEIAKMAFSVLTDEFTDVDVPVNFLTAKGISSGFGNVQVNLGANSTTDTFIHGQTKFTASTNGSEATNGKIHVFPYATSVSPYILIESLADNGDYLKLQTNASGASTISTVDDGGEEADLTLDPDGELILTPVTEVKSDAPLKIKESADAVADTAGYGQIWVDTATPNELAFTDDAGTDIIGIGKYHYETKFVGFYAGQTAQYIPMTGYIIEKTSTASSNEFISFVAPYNCTIEKFIYRSEVGQDGTFSLRILESSDATEVPSSLIYRKDTTIDIDDDTFLDYDLTSPSVGSDYAPLTKGKIYAIYVATPAVGYDTNITVVFKWDITS